MIIHMTRVWRHDRILFLLDYVSCSVESQTPGQRSAPAGAMAPLLFRLLLVLLVAGTDGLRKHHRRHGHKRVQVANTPEADTVKAVLSDESLSDESLMAEERMAEKLVKEAEEKVDNELASRATKDPAVKEHKDSDAGSKVEKTNEKKAESRAEVKTDPAPKSKPEADEVKSKKQNEKKEDADKDDDDGDEDDAEETAAPEKKDNDKSKSTTLAPEETKTKTVKSGCRESAVAPLLFLSLAYTKLF
eukprot:s400_g5.t2